MANVLQDHWYVGDDANATNSASVGVQGANWYAETFTASDSYDLTYVTLVCLKAGSPTGNFTVTINDTTTQILTTAKPAGILGTSDPVAISTFTTGATGAPVTFTFSTPVSIVSGTIYSLVFSAPDTGASTCSIRRDTSAPLYGTGSLLISSNSGSTWGSPSTAHDILFETFSTTATVTLSVTGGILGTSTLAATPNLIIIKHVTGGVTGTSTLAGSTTIVILLHVTGVMSGVSSLSGTVLTGLLTFIYPRPRTRDDTDLDWSDDTNEWAADLTIQGAGGARYLITEIAFSLDADSNGIIFLGS
jgi:hypothetical protein